MNSFLILHKVRGEAAFDIAEPVEISGEKAWIISTSGHRAYPYWNCELSKFGIEPAPLPPELPDHYAANEKPRRASSPAKRTPTLDDIL